MDSEITDLVAAGFGGMVGESRALLDLFVALRRAAQSDCSVLLQGESGTGKRLAAEGIHASSSRSGGPFVVVDCSALTASLAAFERAQGGTLLLDQIDELSLALQPKLLRMLERRQIQSSGAGRVVPIDVRMIAASDRDLARAVEARRFRADLYYRIAVVEVRLPPLREHPEDIPILVEHLLEKLGAASRPEAELLRAAARGALRDYGWPGNVRELESTIERSLALSRLELPGAPSDAGGFGGLREARKRWIHEFEERYLRDLLARHKGNVSAAARAAGVDRKYLHRLLVKHGLR